MAKRKKYQPLVDSLEECIGGKTNISFFTHCVTRLRLNFKDKNLVNTEKIGGIQGVIGTQWAGNQLQIIIGSGVEDAYDELCEAYDLKKEASVNENLDEVKTKLTIKTVFPILLDTLTAI